MRSEYYGSMAMGLFLAATILLLTPGAWQTPTSAQQSTETFATGGDLDAPYDLAFAPNGILAVSGAESKTIVVFDELGELVGTVLFLENPPTGLAYQGLEALWGGMEPGGVSEGDEGFVFLIDPMGQVTTVDSGVGFDPRGMVRGTGGNIFVAERSSETVLEYSVVTREPSVFAVPGNDGCFGIAFIAFSPVNGDLYVTCRDSGEVYRYAAGGLFVLKWSVSSAPSGIAVDTEERVYIARETNDAIERYDGGGDFIDIFAVGLSSPRGIVFGPDGNLYIANSDTNSVLRAEGDAAAGLCSIAGTAAATGAPLANWLVVLLPALAAGLRIAGRRTGALRS
ncbi:MAG: hypothetical protein V3U74_04110 [Thermodesulfobacteriota bacterium]